MSGTRKQGPIALELEAIASQHLLVDSLQAQGSDRLDFRDLHVDLIRAGLEAAYEAGRRRGAAEGGTMAACKTNPTASCRSSMAR